MEQSLSVALLSVGVVLLLLGLLGSVKFKDYDVGTQSRAVRALVGLLGAVFIGLALTSTGYVPLPTIGRTLEPSPSAAWAGSWTQAFVGAGASSFSGRMELKVVDSHTVAGKFESQIDQRRYRGELRGKVTARRCLEGDWSNQYGQGGKFALELAPDGRSFRGTYAMGDELPSARPSNIQQYMVRDEGRRTIAQPANKWVEPTRRSARLTHSVRRNS